MVNSGNKRKKHHDKDKYYHLAKDQGYRSRAAFKLIQINRKYNFLSKAKVCIDLCAAPGGWAQVAAQEMPKGSIILGLDLLPIRHIRDVKTFVCDITTQEARTIVRKELQTWKADVVLCDGAPNVGAAYMKDAFVQNELALAALKFAVDHLNKNGVFMTKVYRSQDYNALMWVLKQLFNEITPVKPSSSRSQSAEIFLLCQDYKAPHHVDPRFLDPKFVFEQMEDGNTKALSVFDKKFGIQKRQRQGYADDIGPGLRRTKTVSEFINSEEPIQLLSTQNEFVWTEEDALYKQHNVTTDEIIILLNDLKLLGKADFKRLIKWRLKIREWRAKMMKEAKENKGEMDEVEKQKQKEREEKEKAEKPLMADEEEDEDDVQMEINALREKRLKEKKRQKKKEREVAAKLRQRQALGMDLVGFDTPEHESVFNLDQIKTKEDLNAMYNVDLANVTNELDHSDTEIDYGNALMKKKVYDSDSDGYDSDLDKELESNYQTYLTGRSQDELMGTRKQKKSIKLRTRKAEEVVAQDSAMFDGDMKGYYKLLSGKRDGNNSDSDHSEAESDKEDSDYDSSDDIPATYENVITQAKGIKGGLIHKKTKSELVVDFEDVDSSKRSAKAARWFSDDVFANLASSTGTDGKPVEEQEKTEADLDDMLMNDEDRKKINKRKQDGKKRKRMTEGFEGDEELDGEAGFVLSSIPKTDKELRKEKRKKLADKKERKEAKKNKGNEFKDFDIVPQGDAILDREDDPKIRAKIIAKRELIKKGLGYGQNSPSDISPEEGEADFEIAPATKLPRKDDRIYDSDNEDFDEDDMARTLALGTLMMRSAKAKGLVDASYNRFAWNDERNLPEWFVDDEQKHYRPQIPIPKPLLDEMKEKFRTLSSKPIKRVAEARARKKKRAVQRLKAAKKKANSISMNPDLSDKEKLKAIEKAMKNRAGTKSDRPGHVYVVAKNGGNGSGSNKNKTGGKGKIKMVDRRMKSDKRGMDAAAKRKKGGKKK